MMRRMLWGTVFAALLAAAASGCNNSSQPLQGAPKNVQLLFSAKASLVDVYDIWDTKQVTTTTFPDQPGRPPLVETQDLGLWCAVPVAEAARQRSSVTYPYRYRVTVERVRAGNSTPELLTEAHYGSDLASVTDYDGTPLTPPDTHPVDWSINVSNPAQPNITIVIELRGGRRVSTASRDFLISPKIPANTASSYGSACPYGGFGGFAQSAEAFFEPTIAGSYPTFDTELASGDTIIVRASKDPEPLQLVLYTSNPPSFDASMFVDGSDITGTVLGRPSSPLNTEEGIAFSFTYR